MRAKAWIVWAVVSGACAPRGQPTLEIKLTPGTVSDGTPVKVKVIGTSGDGKVGTGTVKIASARGSLVTPASATLDGFGSATAELICDPTTEPECAQSVRVVAEWTSDGIAVSAESRLNSGGATGGGGGTGGGSGAARIASECDLVPGGPKATLVLKQGTNRFVASENSYANIASLEGHDFTLASEYYGVFFWPNLEGESMIRVGQPYTASAVSSPLSCDSSVHSQCTSSFSLYTAATLPFGPAECSSATATVTVTYVNLTNPLNKTAVGAFEVNCSTGLITGCYRFGTN